MLPAIEHRPGRPEYSTLPFRSLVKVRDVLRPDGRYGTAEVTGEPDTFFTVPARMSIGGRKVSGWLTTEDMTMVTVPDAPAESMFAWPDAGDHGWPDLHVWLFHAKHLV